MVNAQNLSIRLLKACFCQGKHQNERQRKAWMGGIRIDARINPIKNTSHLLKTSSQPFELLSGFNASNCIELPIAEKICLLENIFNSFDVAHLSFTAFVQGLLSQTVWREWDCGDHFYRACCLELASEIDRLNNSMGIEPAYHSRKHFQDVCISLTLLLSQNVSVSGNQFEDAWNIDVPSRWLLLLCAISHDIGHDGTRNAYACELESRSIDITRSILELKMGNLERVKKIMAILDPVVLATDPAHFNQLSEQIKNQNSNLERLTALSALMVEADLLASVLPHHGELLGRRLGVEWSNDNPDIGMLVASKEGRLNFLRKLQFFSWQSKALGMPDILKMALENLTSELVEGK